MIGTITNIRENYKELSTAIKAAKTASASISDGKFACLIQGVPTIKGNEIKIQVAKSTSFITFPENYIRSWTLKGQDLQFILKTL